MIFIRVGESPLTLFVFLFRSLNNLSRNLFLDSKDYVDCTKVTWQKYYFLNIPRELRTSKAVLTGLKQEKWVKDWGKSSPSVPVRLCSVHPPATWMVCTGPHLHLQGTAACLNPWGPPLTQPVPSGAGQHLSYLTLSVLFHLLGCTAPSSLREYLSLTLGRSCLQRLRVPVLFSVPLPKPRSQDRSHSLASICFHGVAAAPNIAAAGSPVAHPWQLKPLHISAHWG